MSIDTIRQINLIIGHIYVKNILNYILIDECNSVNIFIVITNSVIELCASFTLRNSASKVTHNV